MKNFNDYKSKLPCSLSVDEQTEMAALKRFISTQDHKKLVNGIANGDAEALKVLDEIKNANTRIAELDQRKRDIREVYDADDAALYKEFENDANDDLGLNDAPEEIRSHLWSLAYDKGHSEGYSGVYYALRERVDLYDFIIAHLNK